MRLLAKLRAVIGNLRDALAQPFQLDLESLYPPPVDGFVSGKQKPIDPKMATAMDAVVTVAYMGGFAVQSNYARSFSSEVAAAASMGLITTENIDGTYGRIWRPTTDGLLWCRELRESEG